MSANYLFIPLLFLVFGYAVTVSKFSELFSYAATVFFPELILHKYSVEGYPRATELWICEVEDAKSIVDLITTASITGRPIPDLENLDSHICKRTQEHPNSELQETSHHSRGKAQSRRDQLQANRLLG